MAGALHQISKHPEGLGSQVDGRVPAPESLVCRIQPKRGEIYHAVCISSEAARIKIIGNFHLLLRTLTSSAPNKWSFMGHALPKTRVFVIQFSAEADPGRDRFIGRLEHVESGRSERFVSSQAMKEFFARVLREEEGGMEQAPGDSATKCLGVNHSSHEGESE
jgi:hypothetical protein